MQQTRRMRRNSAELEYLTTFLNLQLGKLKRSTLTDYYAQITRGVVINGEASAEAQAFAAEHDLLDSAALIQAQNDLRGYLWDLVDPESTIPIRADKETRARIKRDIVDKYLKDPTRPLARLVRHLNQIAITSRWALYPATKGNSNLHLERKNEPTTNHRKSLLRYEWLLKKTEFRPKDKIYGWMATVLERDELSKLGHCRTCGKYFIRNRYWQLDCSPKCKKTYDNILSAERKAEAAAKQKRITAADEKKNFYQLLMSNEFRRRLPGGPTTQGQTQLRLLNEFSVCRSPHEFKQQCEPQFRRIIDAMTS